MGNALDAFSRLPGAGWSMMLIKLSDGCYVDAYQIDGVRVNEKLNGITVRMKNGIGHFHEPGYGQGVYEALVELVRKIGDATTHSL